MQNNPFVVQNSQLSKLVDIAPVDIDLFICSASYESRSLCVPENMPPARVRKTIVLQNEKVLGAGKAHTRAILEHFGEAAEPLFISKSEAIITGDKIVDALLPYASQENVTCCIDITCMTHEALLILFIVTQEILPPSANIWFLYTSAEEYDPGADDEVKWLSRGIEDVRSVLGFPGALKPSQQNHLIVLVGFEVERTMRLVNVLEPHSMSFGLGMDEPINEKSKRVNIQKGDRLKVLFPGADSFGFSPTDAYKVKDKILEHADKFRDKNIIVAPMNTKISTLGVALAVMERPDIQVVYASAAFYNVDSYSTPSDSFRMFQL